MGRKRSTGGRSARSGRSGGGIAQLPRRQVINPYQPIELADPDQIQQLHDTSMRILSELGIRVMSDRVMALFEAAGASVDRGTSIIRLDESIVMEAVGKAPGQFTLTGHNADKRLTIGGNNICFGLVAGPPNVHDRINGRRDGNLADYQNFIRLAHHFNAIDIIGNQVISPVELPANNRHLDTYFANLTLSDLSPI